MRASDVMTTGAATVRPDARLAEAARIMVEHRISGLPVVDSSGKLVGIITERDFLRREDGARARWIDVLLGEAASSASVDRLRSGRVEQVMTKHPLTVAVDTPVAEIAELMERHGVKRLPVVTDGKIVGIVSGANLLLALVRRAGRTDAQA